VIARRLPKDRQLNCAHRPFEIVTLLARCDHNVDKFKSNTGATHRLATCQIRRGGGLNRFRESYHDQTSAVDQFHCASFADVVYVLMKYLPKTESPGTILTAISSLSAVFRCGQ
jgi:hypothetical protein